MPTRRHVTICIPGESLPAILFRDVDIRIEGRWEDTDTLEVVRAAKLIDISWDRERDYVRLVLEHENFMQIGPGQLPPDITDRLYLHRVRHDAENEGEPIAEENPDTIVRRRPRGARRRRRETNE